MTHCNNCGVALTERDGVWVHEASPDGYDPAYCVFIIVDSVPVENSAAMAEPCVDSACPVNQNGNA